MATAPGRVRSMGLLIVLNIWVWGFSWTGLQLRWRSSPIPAPPIYEAFPYGEFRVGIDPSNPPFAQDNNGALTGFEVELANLLGEEMGVPVRLVPLGFDGLYDAITADVVDAVISTLVIDTARSTHIRYTQPYFDNGLVLVSPVTSSITKMHDLHNRSIAFAYAGQAHTELNNWTRRIDAIEQKPYELSQHALDAVRLSQADSALVTALDYRLYRQEYPAIALKNTYVTHVPYAIAVRIDRVQTWQLLNRALDRIQQSDQLEELINRWL